MRKNLLWLTIALYFVCAQSVQAHDVDSCDPFPDVPINITPVFDEPQYDYSKNLAEIQAIASDRQHSIPQYHSITLGITRYEPMLEFHVPIVVHEPRNGAACAYVQHVDVTIGYRNVTVFIANEIPRPGCGFDETMAHEQKHIAVNREILQKFVPLIEERFKSYLKLNGVLQVQNAKYAQQVISERLQSIIEDMIGQMGQENIREQREVDSAEEYNRLSHVCNGDLGVIADLYRRTGR